MKRFSNIIALFMVLAVLADDVLAAQMLVTMQNYKGDSNVATQTLPCHAESAADEQTSLASDKANATDKDCCNGNCNGCMLSAGLTLMLPELAKMIPHSMVNTTVENHLLAAHAANLYKPPILS